MKLSGVLKILVEECIEEARLSDLLKITGDNSELHKYIEKEKSKSFDIDRELPTQLTLKKRYNNKKIKVFFKWYDTAKHNLKKRIAERTNLKSISEFTNIFNEAINNMLPSQLGVNISENGRYGINVTEYGLTIIFYIDLNNFDDKKININIITILPKGDVDEKNLLNLFLY